MIRSKLLIISIITIATLMGCSSLTPLDNSQLSWQDRQELLTQIPSFVVNGKFAYIPLNIDDKTTRSSADFFWQHKTNQNQLKLINFLGQTLLDFQVGQYYARAVTIDNQEFSSTNADELIHRLTNLHLPISHLNNWLLAIATNDHDILIEQNNIVQITKKTALHKWIINYITYTNIKWHGNVLRVPSKIEIMAINDRKLAEFKIILLINNWNIAS